MVVINKYSEKLTFVHLEFPGLCDFKLACDNMKERLRSKDPEIRWHRAFSICFYTYRSEIYMISMHSRFARTQKLPYLNNELRVT